MTSVNMLEAKTNLSRLVDGIERGIEDEIVIARNGRPAARLLPIRSAKSADKRIGLLRSRFTATSLDDMDVDNAEVAALFWSGD